LLPLFDKRSVTAAHRISNLNGKLT